jgi:hypothetical protein
MMKKLIGAVCTVLLLLSVALASDLSGKWSGSFVISGPDGGTKDSQAFLELKQNGNELAGTVGPSLDKQWTIQKGKIEGDKLTFEVQSDGPLIKFELTLSNDHLKGEAKAEQDGQTLKAAVDLQRAAK